MDARSAQTADSDRRTPPVTIGLRLHALARDRSKRIISAPSDRDPRRLCAHWSPGLLAPQAGSMVFISYRRSDSEPTAIRLLDALSLALGSEQVFMDREHITPGLQFPEVIAAALHEATDMLVLIGPTWADPHGAGARLHDTDDWVRREIESGIERKIRIIPVLLDGAEPLVADQLPPSLREIAGLQAVRLRTDTFLPDAQAIARLVERRPNAIPLFALLLVAALAGEAYLALHMLLIEAEGDFLMRAQTILATGPTQACLAAATLLYFRRRLGADLAMVGEAAAAGFVAFFLAHFASLVVRLGDPSLPVDAPFSQLRVVGPWAACAWVVRSRLGLSSTQVLAMLGGAWLASVASVVGWNTGEPVVFSLDVGAFTYNFRGTVFLIWFTTLAGTITWIGRVDHRASLPLGRVISACGMACAAAVAIDGLVDAVSTRYLLRGSVQYATMGTALWILLGPKPGRPRIRAPAGKRAAQARDGSLEGDGSADDGVSPDA